MPTDEKDVLAILALISKHDEHGALWWRCDGEYAPVTFFVNCNDLWFWACADLEELRLGDLPALEQATQDAGPIYGTALWACRKRAMRPQQPFYERLSAEEASLFDACGPVRTE